MKNYLGSVFSIIFLLFPCLGMEEGHGTKPGFHPSFFSPFYEFARERISGLYFTTSVVGYDSENVCIAEFLKGQFKDEWTIADPICLTEELSSLDEVYKVCSDLLGEDGKLLGFSPGQSINDLNIVSISSTCSYLYKEGSDTVKIIFLNKCSILDCFTTKKFENFTPDQLEEKRVLYINTLLELLKDKNTDLNSGKYKKISDEYEELKEYLATRKISIFPAPVFDYSKEDSFVKVSDCLLEICKKFNHKPIEIHTLVRSQEPRDSNFVTKLATSADFLGHLSYAQIDMDMRKKKLVVNVIDPTFDPEHPYIKPLLGSLDPLPAQSLRLFQKIADSISCLLDHHYDFRGDQVVNFHDCGRFSTIYLLFQTEGRNALNLSNYDVYQGFKRLEAGGYHLMHQTQSEKNPLPKFQTKFTRFLTGPFVRFPCDFILRTFFNDDKSENPDIDGGHSKI